MARLRCTDSGVAIASPLPAEKPAFTPLPTFYHQKAENLPPLAFLIPTQTLIRHHIKEKVKLI